MCESEFEVVDVEVEADEDDGDVGIEGAAVGHGGEVFGGNVAAEGGVGAADVGDGFGGELVFYAGFAEDEDFVFGGGEAEDAGDVDCGTVGGAEDFVLREACVSGGFVGGRAEETYDFDGNP